MAKKSVNINHSSGAILSNDGTYVKIGDGSAVKIGFATSISNGDIDNFGSDILKNYEGALRINKTTNKLEYCDGTSWIEFVTEMEGEDIPMVYSLIF